jgi:hypothetical protein
MNQQALRRQVEEQVKALGGSTYRVAKAFQAKTGTNAMTWNTRIRGLLNPEREVLPEIGNEFIRALEDDAAKKGAPKKARTGHFRKLPRLSDTPPKELRALCIELVEFYGSEYRLSLALSNKFGELATQKAWDKFIIRVIGQQPIDRGLLALREPAVRSLWREKKGQRAHLEAENIVPNTTMNGGINAAASDMQATLILDQILDLLGLQRKGQ